MALTEWFLRSLTLTICLVFVAHTEQLDQNQLTHIKHITRENFAAFSGKSSVTIVYFFRKDLPSIQNFLKEYEKSAELLEIYNVDLATLDCLSQDSEEASEYCDQEGTEENVYAFRGGHELLALPLENTFDVNSIMSNVLQIVLLREVPIIQTLKEREEFEEQNKGQYDVILSYQAAIGTYEHRVLMEVAFAYHHKYKFVITTEKPPVADLIGSGTGESSMLWVLQCKTATQHTLCEQSKVLDNIDLVSLARFMKVLNINLVHDIAESGIHHPYDAHRMHKVFLYYSRPQQAQVANMAANIRQTFYGVVAIILVDVEHPQAAMFGYTTDVKKVPGVSILLRDSNELLHMPGAFTSLAVEAFIGRVLESTLRGIPSMPEDESYENDDEGEAEKLLAAVETQDDQVAEAVGRLSREELDRRYVAALTDVTFTPETTEQPLRIVIFYLTFDARSMAFMRSYVDASLTLGEESLSPLAAVDCFDWTDVCGKNNITRYPTVRVYRQGRPAFDYKGMLGAAPIVSLVKLLLVEAPVTLGTQQQASEFLEGLYPRKLQDVTDVAVLGLFDQSQNKELTAFKKAAMRDHGETVYGYYTADGVTDLCKRFNTHTPAVVVYKRHDMWDSHKVYQGDMTSSNIVDFVKNAVLPVFPELTPFSFPAYFAKKLPFVILFDEHTTPGQGAHAQVAEVIKTAEFPGFIFGWMELFNPLLACYELTSGGCDSPVYAADNFGCLLKEQQLIITLSLGTRDDGVAGKVLLEYNRNADPPALFVVDHASGYIYNFGAGMLTTSAVTSWLRKVTTKEAMPWKMLEEGEWKPLNPGYDFLKMIDAENIEDGQDEYDPPMNVPKMDLDLTPPGEEEEKEIREALKRVHAESMPGNSADTSTHAHQHTEL